MTADTWTKLVALIDWTFVVVCGATVLALLAGLCIISAKADQADEDHYGVEEARRS